MKYADDLFSPEELVSYKATAYPFNLDLLYLKLQERIKTDLEYEVWVPVVYYVYLGHKKSVDWPDVITPIGMFVSNKGNVRVIRNDTAEEVNTTLGTGNGGYLTISTSVNKKGRNLPLHRVVACSFLPLDKIRIGNDRLFLAHPSRLQVNHLDGIKTNPDLFNLEWATHSGNQQHAVLTGLVKTGEGNRLTKPVKGTILIGEFKGFEFVLCGAKECVQHGFTQSKITACAKGRVSSHKNCKWAYATADETNSLPRRLPDNIKLTISGKSYRFSHLYYSGVIATVM